MKRSCHLPGGTEDNQCFLWQYVLIHSIFSSNCKKSKYVNTVGHNVRVMPFFYKKKSTKENHEKLQSG
jgi:hypothetical protein